MIDPASFLLGCLLGGASAGIVVATAEHRRKAAERRGLVAKVEPMVRSYLECERGRWVMHYTIAHAIGRIDQASENEVSAAVSGALAALVAAGEVESRVGESLIGGPAPVEFRISNATLE